MKYFFSLLLFLLFITSQAQEWETIVDTTKLWSVSKECRSQYSNSYISVTTTSFRFQGKKIINNLTYSYLKKCSDSLYETWSHTGFLFRTDSLKGDYVYKSGVEYLIFNYDVKLGDTIVIPEPDMFSYFREFKVDSVSVLYYAGKMRKAVYAGGGTKPLYYQGFGSLKGVLFFDIHFMDDCIYSMNCFSQDGTLLYQARDCYVSYEEDEEPDLPVEKFEIFPNIVTNFINVNNVPEKIVYRIIDINGRELKKDYLKDRNNIIPFPYPTGFYILELKYEFWKIIKTEKIVKLSL